MFEETGEEWDYSAMPEDWNMEKSYKYLQKMESIAT
jgi:hypothetical protein